MYGFLNGTSCWVTSFMTNLWGGTCKPPSHRRLVSCPQTNIQQPLRLGAPINSMIALVTCSVHMKMIVYVALSIHPIYPSVSQHCHLMPCFIIQKTFAEKNHQIWHFPDLDRKYEGVILLLRGSVSLQINGVEVDVSIRFDSIGCGKLGRPESVSKIDTGRKALADVLEFF